ncbi:uncharacterized protein LOC104582994 [Brachypodium distachyon]|uniref:uncharacterized protein LOC104582994 n=1 Tax=Brachypodium distachyon TaxID=15368 RepID=UPI00052FF49C|nr:uncharacterized protein LOC104582994 [Brachypodium distachyon]|eukprot:XP_010232937.1 uncharacterized protein LOC104582994 [Brachypodium distachyon]
MGSTDKKADAPSAVENCACPEPGCLFEGSCSRALVQHLADAHARPIYAVRYGQPWNFTMSLSRPWDVAFGVGEDGRSAFFVVLQAAAPGGGAFMSVSLQVCVRDQAACGVQGSQMLYRSKMTLESLSGDKKKRVATQPAVCDRVHMEVPQEMVLSGETIAVSIQIDQVLQVGW